MNRPIKFRAWDKKKGRFIYLIIHPTNISWSAPYYTSQHVRSSPEEYEDIEGIVFDDISGWMQYTGLTDKNGKEIYEGDIIEFETPGGTQRPYVSFEPLVAAFVVDYWKKGKKESDAEFLHEIVEGIENEVEIIGNVYENEELLSNRLTYERA